MTTGSHQPQGRVQAHRYHDISCGHRVFGHESKCAHLHGHNYRIHFTLEGELDKVGRVLDFSVIKSVLCQWLEEEWDHKFLIWKDDEVAYLLLDIDKTGVILVPFNPTAENMAKHLVEVVGPRLLGGRGVRLTDVKVEETAKCHASYHLTTEK